MNRNKVPSRNGGRPAMPRERRTVRKTVTMPPEYWQYLATVDSNRSAAIRKVIDAARPPTAPEPTATGAQSATHAKRAKEKK